MKPNDADKHFVFVHRDLQYALPVLDVLEIVETPVLQPAHGEMAGYLGNVSHRDHLLPVLDPTALGTGRGVAPMSSRTFVVVRRGDILFGLAMDRFVGVVPLEEADAPSSKEDLAAGANPFVETVRAFRHKALLSLAIDAIASLVQRSFRVQQQRMVSGEGIRGTPRDALAESERIFLCARIDHLLFSIPVEQVSEVIEGSDVTPLFKLPPLVRGLINLRGQVLACLDISTDLGLSPRLLEERNQFVVLERDGASLALCVDKVTGIRRLAPERFQNAEMVVSAEMTRYATDVLEEPDGPLFLLSVPAVFDAPQL